MPFLQRFVPNPPTLSNESETCHSREQQYESNEVFFFDPLVG